MGGWLERGGGLDGGQEEGVEGWHAKTLAEQ
jgi:hypothetical protein